MTVEIFDGDLIVGSDATLRCLSDMGVADRIEWRAWGRLVASRNLSDHLDLVFCPVNDSLEGFILTCFVTRNRGRAYQTVSNKTFHISVRGGCVQYDACMW